jgi:hypothetical protein
MVSEHYFLGSGRHQLVTRHSNIISRPTDILEEVKRYFLPIHKAEEGNAVIG